MPCARFLIPSPHIPRTHTRTRTHRYPHYSTNIGNNFVCYSQILDLQPKGGCSGAPSGACPEKHTINDAARNAA